MTVGQRLQQIRQQLSLSQEEFGEKLGVSRQTVSKWELDQTFPDLSKIVLISKMFSVTTDSILIEGITSFDIANENYVCGIYKGELCEIVVTEKYALVYYCSPDKSLLGTKLYVGYMDKKHLRAICVWGKGEKKTKYAYITDEERVITNDSNVANRLGEKFEDKKILRMLRSEKFVVSKDSQLQPTVSDVGILKALQSWRMCSKYVSNTERFSFSLCTAKTEYIFSIEVDNDNIYCGASNNLVFDLGLYCAGQYFRIRNYKDNSEPFCGFGCDFSYTPKTISVPTDKCDTERYCKNQNGIMFTVKRYDDEQIVLKGCGGDEYVYQRNEKRAESYIEFK
ncbi:MAG: helix-turn-helix transcriptional regulator [Clostridia bacterium]|nr:helix-turn-helix transcriptional regulator [Clostridia bacterium]